MARKFSLTEPEKLPGWTVEGGLVLLLILAAWALRQAVYVILFTDSIGYLSFARNVLTGVHHGDGITIGRYMYPPLYPHLMAFFSLGNADPFHLAETGRQVSVWAGALTVLPVYWLARSLFGPLAAAVSSFILVLAPEFLYYSGAVLTESTATFLVALALCFLWRCTFVEGGSTPVNLVVLGVVLGLSFLTRHAAVGFLGLSAVWITAQRFSRAHSAGVLKTLMSLMIPLALVLGGFLAAVGPQVVYLRAETGLWTLTGNLLTDPSRSWEHAGSDLRFTNTGESGSALTPDGKSFLFEGRERPDNPVSSLLSVIVRSPFPYLKAYASTVAGGLIRDTRDIPYPPVVLVFALAGVFFLAARRKFRELAFLVWIFCGFYLFLALFHNMRDRYMFPVLPILVVLAGAGASSLLEWITRRTGEVRAGVSVPAMGGVFLMVILFAYLFPASRDLVSEVNPRYDMGYYRAMHEELSSRIDPGSRMFDRMPHRAFFSGAERASVPYDSIERVVEFGRLRGVRYWIVSWDYVPRLRPQFAPLLEDPDRYAHLLRKIAVYGDADRRTVLLEIPP